MFFIYLFLILIFLCWGSFLNVVAYRSVSEKPILQKRSTCNFCNKLIFWYDNIPVISWFLLSGRCRHCKKKISRLYSFIEILTLVLMFFLFFKFIDLNNLNSRNFYSFFAYFMFFSALIISVRTDLHEMVISRIFSLWFIPLGLLFSFLGFLKINLLQSFLGSIFGYSILFFVAVLFKYFTKRDGLGIGDMEFLSMIGSFLGPLGVWITILVASFSGLLIGGLYLFITKKGQSDLIPFGPFLALGAAVFVFFYEYIIYYSIPF